MAQLGRKGVTFVEELEEYFTDSASLCTEWQQDFFKSFAQKANRFGEEAYITDKQLAQLNKIAETFGLEPKTMEDLQ